jgi:hypothetical protein
MKNGAGVVLIVLLAGALFATQTQSKSPDKVVHGRYEELQPAQKKLVDQWYGEYNRMTGDRLTPADYDQLPVSTRTTFEAVTHALLTTHLTDASGHSLGNALDLVQAIETVSGKVPNVRGDLQFRIYVVLTPTALETLKQSKEFYRDHDNTVYHKGYPTSYRQGGGDPSIQVSMSKDGRRADIDVDYRSSRFPAGLFNGHLSSANSDVRAGNNTQRHVGRWIGLTDWWQLLFGLPGTQEAVSVTQEGEIPAQPRKGTGNLEAAVQDFLSTWLVEQKPELAAAYLSPRSFSCLEEYGPQAGTDLNVGVAPYVAAKDMAATMRLVGKVTSMQEVATAYPVQDASFKPLKQQKDTVFSLSQVTNRAATEIECDPQKAYDEFDRFRSAGALDKFGDYYASTFRLRAPAEKSDGITLLWTKDNRNWKIVAWDIEPEERKPDQLPDTRLSAAPAPSRQTPETDTIQAAPGLQQAVSKFFQTWLVKDDSADAASYFSQHCYECINLYLAEGEAPPASLEAQGVYLRNGLAAISKEIGPIHDPKEALEPVSPEHDGLRPLKHADAAAYSLVAVPDSLADAFQCSKRSAENPYRPAADEIPVYGTYYAAAFAVRTPGDHPATVSFLWKKEDGQWKIVAYDLTN